MKISIIIPTYNRASLLPRAILSIPKNIDAEIVVVDDYSTDNTVDIVKSLALNDDRIILIQLKSNGGVNIARNAGIRQSKGDWVCFLDSDDEYIEGGAAVLFEKLSIVPETISVVGFMTMREVNGVMESRGFKVKEKWITYQPSYQEVIFKENIMGDINYSVRRSIFFEGYKFDENINGFEIAFFAKLIKDGKKFLYINEIVDKRYISFDLHLSNEPYKRWPQQFGNAYLRFFNEHYEVISTKPKVIHDFCMRIAKCKARSFDPRAIFWIVRSLIVNL